MSILSSTVVLGTNTALQAAGADISVSQHHLNITLCPSMDYRKILTAGLGLIESVAETPGVLTITPVNPSVNATTYAFQLQQDRPDLGITVTALISYTAEASGTTQTIVSDAFKAAIAANPNFRVTTNATGNATTVITAAAGYPAIRATNLSSISTNIAIVVTTAYVKSVGTYDDLVAMGVDPSELNAAHTYAMIRFEYVSPDAGDFTLGDTVRTLTLFVDEDDANYAAFATLMGTTLLAYKPATTVSDPKALELIS